MPSKHERFCSFLQRQYIHSTHETPPSLLVPGCCPHKTDVRWLLQVLEEEDIIVEFMRIHWGLKDANPVNRVSQQLHRV